MNGRQFVLFFLLILAIPAFNQSLAQGQKGGQDFPFVFDVLGASLFKDEIIISVHATRTDIPTSGFAQVGVFYPMTGESKLCISTNFDLIIHRGNSSLFFITEGGFQCETAEPILVECKVTDDTLIRNSVFNELVRSSIFGTQKTQGRTDFYNLLACELHAFGFEDVVEGFALTMRTIGTPIHP